jgi:hypothetical protein
MRSFRSTLARLAKQLGLRRAGGLFESEYLRSLGFDVRTVIDVGVDRGTKPLYDAFNDFREQGFGFGCRRQLPINFGVMPIGCRIA